MADAAQQPKKAQTAFFRFLDDQRAAIQKKLGTKKLGDVAKAASEQWKALDQAAKAPYEERAAKEKAEYDAALASFKAAGGEVTKKDRKRKGDDTKRAKKDKDKDAPKKPAGGGYGQFLAENREKIKKSLPQDHKMTDVGKEAGSQWKALSDAAKKPYEEKFKAAMEEYRTAMEAYKASKAEAAGEDAEEQQATPTKRARKGEKTTAPKEKKSTPPKAAPKARNARSSKNKGPEKPTIEEDVLTEARKLGWESALQNLAGRQEVKDLGKSDKELLAAIKTSGGLVNPARRALLGC